MAVLDGGRHLKPNFPAGPLIAIIVLPGKDEPLSQCFVKSTILAGTYARWHKVDMHVSVPVKN